MDGYAAFVSEDFLCTQGSKAITRAMEAAGMRLIERPLPPHVDFVVSPGAALSCISVDDLLVMGPRGAGPAHRQFVLAVLACLTRFSRVRRRRLWSRGTNGGGGGGSSWGGFFFAHCHPGR